MYRLLSPGSEWRLHRQWYGRSALPDLLGLLPQDQELYVFAESRERIAKERAMRRRQLKWLWHRLQQLSTMSKLTREALLMKLGAAQSKAPAAWHLVSIEMAVQGACFGYWLNRKKLREVRRREGRYLLRTKSDRVRSSQTLEHYIQLVAVEEAFKHSRAICRSAQSSIRKKNASKRTSSSPSSPTACT